MFGFDPLSRPVAVAEMLLLLALAAFVGWLLGRLVPNSRISGLRAAIAGQEAELEKCRRSQPAVAPARSEPVEEPSAFVASANPLMPAFRHDDTPSPIAAGDAAWTNPSTVGMPDTFMPDTETPTGVPPDTSRPVSVLPSVSEFSAAGNSEAAVLSRIAARAGEVNFDRIGRATAAEADDLKDIVGIGPFLERKLHSIGIYTFRQVANFTKEDADQINSIIEFFPGRIERDNWVDQSQVFHERKYGQRNAH